MQKIAVNFSLIKQYLNKIAAKGALDPADSGHGLFWQTDYNSFKTGFVPSKKCGGKPVPIIDPVDPAKSAFLQILKSGGFCGMPQMPKTGPFIDSAGYNITLDDSSIVAGAKILQDIEDWLRAGAPEK